MAVSFLTSYPTTLLENFNKHIEQAEPKGKITTWELSADRQYYTHKAPDWTKKAWFKPTSHTDRLTFNIIKPKSKNITKVVYGYYHGHLIETFLNHFDKDFSQAIATALPVAPDKVSEST